VIQKILSGKITSVIHRYFTRFGKGDFDGPVFTANVRAHTISVSGDFEFFDDMVRLFLTSAPYEIIQLS